VWPVFCADAAREIPIAPGCKNPTFILVIDPFYSYST
jgi:hypothetical protein